ncbi:hypothetical protein ACVIHI_001506 [Bradyrhizobium sp. USDA 4524]|uniref:hypothetical protein n=1 Tax=unclassified Bradyrhizobium TaxID=2631580 RepID=UPI0020A1A6C9|nr:MULTISPECIES: hypothetical protein [unclassified Bradyrhizobium]MCP1837118.1 hypothetical protein [Bradyrhizobium sp. USDA 4538]MCP1906137.1 hypothetical protein [Bradyrhizobium sp. USDA 4537]MCP1988209.1 hypothetical protein [Bradyrhizobium sp. USDA 4539]
MTPLPRGATDEGAQNVGMTLPPEYVCGLADGTAHQFGQWPNPKVPKFGAGVYTIWHSDGAFVYVGMSGRGISEATVPRNTPHGIYTRLHSHASGRRSGDQFCVYVADRFVLPMLTQEDIAAITSGRHQMDTYVRRYIHENLLYRYLIVQDGRTAPAIEAAIKAGTWGRGRPILNP